MFIFYAHFTIFFNLATEKYQKRGYLWSNNLYLKLIIYVIKNRRSQPCKSF